jgi:hypothetical protein
MLSDWVSFLAYPNLFGIKGFVVVDTKPQIWASPPMQQKYKMCISNYNIKSYKNNKTDLSSLDIVGY